MGNFASSLFSSSSSVTSEKEIIPVSNKKVPVCLVIIKSLFPRWNNLRFQLNVFFLLLFFFCARHSRKMHENSRLPSINRFIGISFFLLYSWSMCIKVSRCFSFFPNQLLCFFILFLSLSLLLRVYKISCLIDLHSRALVVLLWRRRGKWMGYFFSRLIDSIATFSAVRTRVIHACFYKNKDNIERLHDGSPLTLHFRNSNLRFAGATSSKYARRFIIYNYNIYGESMIALSRYLVIVLKLISRWNPSNH